MRGGSPASMASNVDAFHATDRALLLDIVVRLSIIIYRAVHPIREKFLNLTYNYLAPSYGDNIDIPSDSPENTMV